MSKPRKPEAPSIRKTLIERHQLDVMFLTEQDAEQKHFNKEYALRLAEKMQLHTKSFNRIIVTNLILTCILLAYILEIPFHGKIPYTETSFSEIPGIPVFILFASANFSAMFILSLVHHQILEYTAKAVLETIYTKIDRYRPDTFNLWAMQYLDSTSLKGVMRRYRVFTNSLPQTISVACVISGSTLYLAFVGAAYYVIHAVSGDLILASLQPSDIFFRWLVYTSRLIDLASLVFFFLVFAIQFKWTAEEPMAPFPKELDTKTTQDSKPTLPNVGL